MIRRNIEGPFFMVPMNAENRNAGRVQQPLPLAIALIIPVIVYADITEKNQYIINCYLMLTDKPQSQSHIAMYISG